MWEEEETDRVEAEAEVDHGKEETVEIIEIISEEIKEIDVNIFEKKTYMMEDVSTASEKIIWKKIALNLSI